MMRFPPYFVQSVFDLAIFHPCEWMSRWAGLFFLGVWGVQKLALQDNELVEQ